MSSGYAERLSEYPDKGVCGLPETHDSERAFASKLNQLSQLLQRSKYTVVLTGAGISTSAGIPDFRGPSGIWTREQQERRKRKQLSRKRRRAQKNGNSDTLPGPGNVESSQEQEQIDDRNDDDQLHSDTGKKNGSSSSWTCRACTLINSENTSICRLCNARKESTRICISIKRKNNNGKTNVSRLDNSPANGRKQNPSDSGNKKTKFASFETALPTYTHRALTHLILHPPTTTGSSNVENSEESTNKNNSQSITYLHHIVTQNVDGLHRKSDLPRDKMSILHGDIFTEVCDTCAAEHVRAHEIQSIGLKHTGRRCTLGGTPAGSCPGRLKDTLLDWEDDLPEVDWERAQQECQRAELVLCLGTSLRIEPAGGLCTYATHAGVDPDTYPGREEEWDLKKITKTQGKEKLGYVIVNLQQTPYDEGASLVIRGRVDDVLKGVMVKLGYSQDWDNLHMIEMKRN